MFFICSRFRSYVVFGSLFVVFWLPLGTSLDPFAHHLGPLAHHFGPLAHHLGLLGFAVGPLRRPWVPLWAYVGRPDRPLRPLGGAIASMDAAWASQSTIWGRFGVNFDTILEYL